MISMHGKLTKKIENIFHTNNRSLNEASTRYFVATILKGYIACLLDLNKISIDEFLELLLYIENIKDYNPKN